MRKAEWTHSHVPMLQELEAAKSGRAQATSASVQKDAVLQRKDTQVRAQHVGMASASHLAANRLPAVAQ